MADYLAIAGLYVDDVLADSTPTRPALINRDPEPDEVQVPVDTCLAMEIVDVGADGVDRSSVRVWVDGALAFEGGFVEEFKQGFNGPGSSAAETADTLALIIDPTAAFASLQEVQVRVVASIVGGAESIDRTYSFTIEDLTAPVVVGAQAVEAKRVRVSFDEPVLQVDGKGPGDALNVAAYSFKALTAPAVSVVPVSVRSAGHSSVDVELDIEMTPLASYRVTVRDVWDIFGNPVGETGNSAVFSGYVPMAPARRDFSLWNMLPAINRREDSTGDLWKWIACLQEVTDLLLAGIDRFPDILDPDYASEPFLNLMLQDMGNPFPFDLSEIDKRRLLSVLVAMYRQKGTAVGIRNAIRFFLGIEITAIEAFHGTTLVLGESELGVDWELGPSDRFSLYAFDITVDRVLTEKQRSMIRHIVDWMKPAHTHFVDLIEPGAPEFVDHWELGMSELGVNTDLH
jgi:phage tail-like protein